MNAVERKPVPTRVLNLNASEASYKPKQRSYRRTNLKKKVLAPDSPGAQMSVAQTAAPKRTRLVYVCVYMRMYGYINCTHLVLHEMCTWRVYFSSLTTLGL